MKAMILAGIVLLPTIALCQEDRDKIDRIVSYICGHRLTSDLGVVRPEIRNEVISRLRKRAERPNFNPNGAATTEYIILIRLGDEETMNQIVDTTRSRWLTGEGWAFQDLLADSVQPAVIPLIAQDFFRSDGDKISYGLDIDIAYTIRPFSIEMSRVAFAIVEHSEAFTPEVREWAKENHWRLDHNPPPLTRDVIQKWWRENEARFVAGEYQAVKAGQVLPAPPATPKSAETPSAPLPTQTTAPSAVERPTPSAVVAAQDASTPSSVFLLTGAGVTIALLIGLLFLWKRRV